MDASDKEVQTESVSEAQEKKVQTEEEGKCLCKGEIKNNKVFIEHDKVVCILKRAECTEEEWAEYEEKIDLLKDFGKVIEAASRLSQK